jgi:hypothetical protein
MVCSWDSGLCQRWTHHHPPPPPRCGGQPPENFPSAHESEARTTSDPVVQVEQRVDQGQSIDPLQRNRKEWNHVDTPPLPRAAMEETWTAMDSSFGPRETTQVGGIPKKMKKHL